MKLNSIFLAALTLALLGCGDKQSEINDKLQKVTNSQAYQEIAQRTKQAVNDAAVNTVGNQVNPSLQSNLGESNTTVEKMIVLPANPLDITVSDGDTISFNNRGERIRVRMLGIDAPEKAQVYGPQSREGLRSCITRGKGSVFYKKKDQYGRLLGRVVINGIDCNFEQVRNGNAWFYRDFANEVTPAQQTALDAAENQAKSNRYGLWQQGNPQAPWQWRKLNK